MLQVCAGAYLVLIVLAAMFLWSSFKAAQRADRVQYRLAPWTALGVSRRARRYRSDVEA